MRPVSILITLGFVLGFGAPAGAEVIISEFVASNNSTLPDEDGDYPDWLELHNTGDRIVNLEGWSLTDDSQTPTEFVFPAIELAPKGFLVVFCSEKFRIDPEKPIHTNFRLLANGEYLGLYKPDGTVAWQFSPKFDEQLRDVSFGFRHPLTETLLLEEFADGKALIPTDDSLGLSWTADGAEFDDSGWIVGQTGFGFDQKSTPTYTDLIRTDLGEAMRRVNATAYLRIPFMVTDPAEFDVVVLRIRYEDGFVAYVNGVEIARNQAPSKPTWNSDSPGSQPTTSALRPEDYVYSGASSLLKAGANMLAIHGLNSSSSNSDFFVLPELVGVTVGEIDLSRRQYFSKSTPGFPNGEGFDQVAPPAVFSVPGGAYPDSVELELSSTLENGLVHYTLDGSIPDEDSPVYTAPIDIGDTTVVKAIVTAPGYHRSRVAEESYVVLAPDVLEFDSNLPLVICTTFGRPMGSNCGGGLYTPGHITVIDRGEDGRTRLTDTPDFSGRCGFRKRGSSTCNRPKFSFNVEIWDEENEDKNAEILDFPVDSDYILYGPYNFDRGLMRNPIAYWMSREVGQWAARTRFVEVFFHSRPGPVSRGARPNSTTDSYFGVYVFMEKNKRHPQKMDLAPLTPQDNLPPEVTGGYILKRDRVGSGEVTTSAGGYGSHVFVYPKSPTAAQKTYITNYVNQAVNSLNPNIGSQEDSDLIDVTSFLDHHILCWYPKNVDAFRLSGYYHKKRNGLMGMGPVWDYDRTMGCSDDSRAADPTGFDNNASGDGGTRYFQNTGPGGGSWYFRLFNNQPPLADTPWNRAYRARWRELRRGPLRTENILNQIDAYAAELAEAAPRNYARWASVGPRGGSFQSEVNILKNWLADRAAWIDAQFVLSPELSHPGGLIEAPLELSMIVDEGEIYYTLDGSDPKAGSDPSATALLYAGPITIMENTLVRARALNGAAWSGIVEAGYYTSIPTLAPTEIMYNPLEHSRDFEFIELYNFGDDPVKLPGATFRRGVTFTFGPEPEFLGPREYGVIVNNLASFQERYGVDSGIKILGDFSGSLSDRAESIALEGAAGEPIFDFRYEDSWYPETDGQGRSLVLADPASAPDSWGQATSWQPSAEIHGSPGARDPASGPGGQRAGDIDQDGKLNVADAVKLLGYLFRGSLQSLPCGDGSATDPGNVMLLDANGDRRVDAADAVHSLRYVFLDGPEPAAGRGCLEIAGCPDVCSR